VQRLVVPLVRLLEVNGHLDCGIHV
jgi:hypothetical protein